MVATCLPTWPIILFGIIEPVLCTMAWRLAVITDPYKYYADQAPNFPCTREQFSPQALSMTLQMGNVLLLLAAFAIICCWTTHREIAIWYLIAVGFADWGHIYGSYQAVGPELFWDVKSWNDMLIGSVGGSAFLNINRWLTVLGVFGRVGSSADRRKKVS